MSLPTSVCTAVGLDLVDEDASVALAASFTYDVRDPFAVEAAFDIGDGQAVRWFFARELLSDGLLVGGGEGDVVIWPRTNPDGSESVMLQLSSPDGSALLAADAHDVTMFLVASYALVPRDTEAELLDLDRAIGVLLGA